MSFQKGFHSPTEFKKGHKLNEKRYRKYPGLRKQIADKLKGKKKSKETRERMKKAQTGHCLSEKSRQKIKGENSPNWRGGTSFEPYSVDWTDDLKRAIRRRDEYTCQICGREPAIDVHHIDYDKKNCDPKNLITLCKGCHSKTNHNREHWRKKFRRVS